MTGRPPTASLPPSQLQPPSSASSGVFPSAHGSSVVVSDFALNVLHTEMVLYVVRFNAQQQAIQQIRAHDEKGEEPPNEEDESVDDDLLYDDDTSDRADDDDLGAAQGKIIAAPGGDDGLGGGTRGACTEYVLESMGIHAGLRITERLLHREPLVRYTPLEITRFVGGHLWRALFGKKVDKMKHLDNIYFSLYETNFAWMRCAAPKPGSSSSSGATAGAGSASSSSGAAGHHSTLSASAVVAPGLSVEGLALDAEAALKEARQVAARGSRELPLPRDMLWYIQGVLRGAVDTLLGPGNAAIVSAQVYGVDAQFVLDFRSCPR